MKDFEYQPLDTLPDDAVPGGKDLKFSFGSDVFGKSGAWVIVENNSDPVRVWKMPLAVTRMMDNIFNTRFEMGKQEARDAMRSALGMSDN